MSGCVTKDGTKVGEPLCNCVTPQASGGPGKQFLWDAFRRQGGCGGAEVGEEDMVLGVVDDGGEMRAKLGQLTGVERIDEDGKPSGVAPVVERVENGCGIEFSLGSAVLTVVPTW